MSTFSLAMWIAAGAGCAIVAWTIALTLRKYSALPARIAYPKNYGDGEEMHWPKLAVWFAPCFQIGLACVVAWAISSGARVTRGTSLTGLIVIDVVLLALLFVQRNIMLRPDSD
jgi:hypothetical protein